MQNHIETVGAKQYDCPQKKSLSPDFLVCLSHLNYALNQKSDQEVATSLSPQIYGLSGCAFINTQVCSIGSIKCITRHKTRFFEMFYLVRWWLGKKTVDRNLPFHFARSVFINRSENLLVRTSKQNFQPIHNKGQKLSFFWMKTQTVDHFNSDIFRIDKNSPAVSAHVLNTTAARGLLLPNGTLKLCFGILVRVIKKFFDLTQSVWITCQILNF